MKESEESRIARLNDDRVVDILGFPHHLIVVWLSGAGFLVGLCVTYFYDSVYGALLAFAAIFLAFADIAWCLIDRRLSNSRHPWERKEQLRQRNRGV